MTPPLSPLPVLDPFETELVAAPVLTKLQINLGLVCNLACLHCHVESSPKRTGERENMSAETADRVMQWIADHPQIKTIDLTGGSPEMNPHFRRLVEHCRAHGRHVMDRCNPTIIPHVDPRTEQRYDWVPKFLAANQVEVVASLPCYLEENVDRQRGTGSYNGSIDGLQQLCHVGYGNDPRLKLNLVYNPTGAHLPPPQESLADAYHRELKSQFGIVFNELWTITNMPIKRWRRDLERQGKLADYMQLLVEAYNPATVEPLMCRHQIHIDSQGRLYDCDFNYGLGLPIADHKIKFLWDLPLDALAGRRIATGDHCYGCTAGSGSSCGGSLV